MSECGWIWRLTVACLRLGRSLIFGSGLDRTCQGPGCVRMSWITFASSIKLMIRITPLYPVQTGEQLHKSSGSNVPNSCQRSLNFLLSRRYREWRRLFRFFRFSTCYIAVITIVTNHLLATARNVWAHRRQPFQDVRLHFSGSFGWQKNCYLIAVTQ